MLVTFGDSVIQTFICFKVTNINTYQETLIMSHIEAQLDCIYGLDKVSKYWRLRDVAKKKKREKGGILKKQGGGSTQIPLLL